MKRIDPKWAELGRCGIAKFQGFFVVFVVVSCTVNDADILVLDTDHEESFPIGRTETFGWGSRFWELAKEIE